MYTKRFMKKTNGFLPHIEGMRAVAVLAVLLNHIEHSWLPGGYLGVDMFFVISGFVITRSLLNREVSSIWSAIKIFYVKRFKRLLPALVVMLVITMFLIRIVNPNTFTTYLTAITSVFGLSNIFLYSSSVDYFGETIALNPLMHTWSLGVEEQFYMVFPVVFYLALKVDNRKRLLNGFICVFSFLSLVFFAFLFDANQSLVYYLMPFRFWELGVGCLLALNIFVAGQRTSLFIQVLSSISVIAAFALGTQMPVLSAALVVSGSVGLILAGSNKSILNQFFTSAPMMYVGKLSYSIYLWHWPLICIALWTVGLNWISISLILVLTMLLSIMSFYLVEKPIRYGSWFGLKATAFVMAMSVGVVFMMRKAKFPDFSGTQEAALAITGYTPEEDYDFASQRSIKDCRGKEISNDPKAAALAIQACGAITEGTPRFVFFGDSHSLDMFGASETLYRNEVASVFNFGQPGCRAPKLDNELDHCNYINTVLKAMPPLKANQKGYVVLRSNYNPKRIDGSLGNYRAKIESYYSQVKELGYAIIYVAPSPKFPSLIPGGLCTEQWFRPYWALSESCTNGFRVSRSEELQRTEAFFSELKLLESRLENFHVFNPFPVLCGPDEYYCTANRNGVPIYRDRSHLTLAGGEILGQEFLVFLRESKIIF
jgi:peptidoglycan/LPS O-acetylase OafA/YrhL